MTLEIGINFTKISIPTAIEAGIMKKLTYINTLN